MTEAGCDPFEDPWDPKSVELMYRKRVPELLATTVWALLAENENLRAENQAISKAFVALALERSEALASRDAYRIRGLKEPLKDNDHG